MMYKSFKLGASTCQKDRHFTWAQTPNTGVGVKYTHMVFFCSYVQKNAWLNVTFKASLY